MTDRYTVKGQRKGHGLGEFLSNFSWPRDPKAAFGFFEHIERATREYREVMKQDFPEISLVHRARNIMPEKMKEHMIEFPERFQSWADIRKYVESKAREVQNQELEKRAARGELNSFEQTGQGGGGIGGYSNLGGGENSLWELGGVSCTPCGGENWWGGVLTWAVDNLEPHAPERRHAQDLAQPPSTA